MQIDPRIPEIDNCLYRLAIRAFIFHEGKVLMVREKDGDWWSFPGGGIDYGETIEEALPRELAEELGISPEDFKTEYQIAYTTLGVIVLGIPRANLFFYVEAPYERIKGGDDVHEIAWFAPGELTTEITARYVGESPDDTKKFIEAIETLAAR